MTGQALTVDGKNVRRPESDVAVGVVEEQDVDTIIEQLHGARSQPSPHESEKQQV